MINNIKKLVPDAQFLYVGTKKGLEADIIPREQIPFATLEISGFERHLTAKNFVVLGKALGSLVKARSIVKKFKPDVAIGTGGYVCGPILMAAALIGVPSLIQEQNAMPGVTNKILARFVKKVFLGYSEAEKYFTGKSRKIYTGNPIRSEILSNKRSEAVKFFGLDPEKQTILVSGGSRGAQSINKAMLYVEQALSGRHDVQVLHATGEANYEEYIKELNKKGSVEDNIVVKPYLHDMPMALAAADLAVFRAGAIGLAELTAKGVPSVLIPYPYATANHQEFNARAVEAAGAAKVILDKELTGEKLLEEIEHLLIRSEDLQKMKKAAKSLGRPGAAKEIAQQALQLVKN